MRPVVGLLADWRPHDGTHVHQVNEEYVAAVRDGAGALPLLIPAGSPDAARESLSQLHGLVLPGSPSNVAPSLYGGPAPRPGVQQDAVRDAAAMALIPAAVEMGLPLFCICRGFQEFNVAMGGSLHQHVHEIPGRLDHREDHHAPADAQYAPAHAIALTPGGVLASLAGVSQARVNSLHHQGIDRLAPGLAVEAVAPDGQIEAISRPGSPGLVLAVQWHPEWRWAEDSLSRALWAAFGAAVRQRAGPAFTTF